MFCIVAYDTSSSKRRRKMAKAILSYARRVQKSVYEGIITSEEYIEMCINIEKVIDANEDNIRIYKIGSGAVESVEIMGKSPPVFNLDYEFS